MSAEILNFKNADNEHLKDAHGLTDHEYQAMYPNQEKTTEERKNQLS
jgi:hypothetical protein